MTEAEDEEEDYFVPLQDQRVFGAGIRRKRVPFVSASSLSSTVGVTTANGSEDEVSKKKKDAAAVVVNRYLSVVLPNEANKASEEVQAVDGPGSGSGSVAIAPSVQICPVCSLPLPLAATAASTSTSPISSTSTYTYTSTSTSTSTLHHETTIPHQSSLPHSHPPSHLPRHHIGLKYLSSYGWDPDSRLGLGSTGTGIRVPIGTKATVKNDTVGLGVPPPQQKKRKKEDEARHRRPKERPKERKRMMMMMNAKEVKKQAVERRKKDERLRELFFAEVDVEKYLGGQGRQG